MVMRYILATILLSISFLSVQAQTTDPEVIATASSLTGMYTCTAQGVECDQILTKLKLEHKANADGGIFTYTKVNLYDDGSRRVTYRYVGEWYVLENKSKAKGDKTTMIVVDIDDFPETYAMFLVRKDGSLQELNRKNPEKMPLYSYYDSSQHEVFIARKAAKPLALHRALYYRYEAHKYLDATFEHVYRKK